MISQMVLLPERCLFAGCTSPDESCRFHRISMKTKAGGQDWSSLVGTVLCNSCKIRFANTGTLEMTHDWAAIHNSVLSTGCTYVGCLNPDETIGTKFYQTNSTIRRLCTSCYHRCCASGFVQASHENLDSSEKGCAHILGKLRGGAPARHGTLETVLEEDVEGEHESERTSVQDEPESRGNLRGGAPARHGTLETVLEEDVEGEHESERTSVQDEPESRCYNESVFAGELIEVDGCPSGTDECGDDSLVTSREHEAQAPTREHQRKRKIGHAEESNHVLDLIKLECLSRIRLGRERRGKPSPGHVALALYCRRLEEENLPV